MAEDSKKAVNQLVLAAIITIAGGFIFPLTTMSSNRPSVQITPLPTSMVPPAVTKASIVFVVPTTMKLDESTTIEVLLNPSILPEALASQVSESGLVYPWSVEYAPRMKASLEAEQPDSFEIQPIHGSPEQVISETETIKWSWSVTAKKAGPQRLAINIYRLVKSDGQDNWYKVASQFVYVEVTTPFGQLVKTLSWTLIAGIVITVTFIGIPALWRSIHDRKLSETPGARIESHNSSEEVYFTAFYPKEGKINTWHTLLVYAHIALALEAVRKDAQKFVDGTRPIKESTSKTPSRIARGTELTIVPFCDGIIFNPEQVSFKWLEDFHRADFRFQGDPSLSGDAAKGQITIYAGPLIIGALKFAMLFNDQEPLSVTEYEEHVKMYGKDDVFISYSRKDTEIARTFKTILAATGMDVFLDVDNIRTGQYWHDELMRRIERAKIFRVFWSLNYSESENCRLEWEHALKQDKEEGYIRPVYWKNPLSPKPPDELNKFNFKYVELNLPEM